MIISVAEIKELTGCDWIDAKIERKLKSIEQLVRQYTNNNFQNRDIRSTAVIDGGAFICAENVPFAVGDTVQVSNSKLNNGLYTIIEVDGNSISVAENVIDENNVLVTKVEYPADVVDCCINLFEWDIKNRDKIGIASETLSRHSVSYVQQNESNTVNGYPASIMGALKLYKKARF